MKSSYKQPDYMTTLEQHKHRPLDKVKQPYPQHHRIVLKSLDRDAGNSRIDARFSGVSIQEALTVPAVLSDESFTLQNKDAGAQNTAAIEVRLRGISHPRSWDSATRSSSDLLCVVQGYDHQGQAPSADAIGIAITDPNQFQNRMLNVYFVGADGVALTEFAGDWTLVLNVVCHDGSLPY